jgi:long-chain acyl-CoA synthetase
VVAGEEVTAQPSHWRLSELDWTPAEFTPVHAKSSDLCEIIFTSGATAEPKGVTITHGNILANIVPVETEILKYRAMAVPFQPLRFLNLLPLSHMFGQSMATFIPPVLAGEVIFMAGFNPREIARQVRSRRISVLVSVPKILEVLREYVRETIPEVSTAPPERAGWMRRWWHYRKIHNLFGWKFWCFVVGAAPLDSELEEFWSNLGFLVTQGYGLTETAPIVTLNHPFHTSKGSVGKAIGGVEIKIADDGEILVRGPNVTAGYFHGGAEDAALFADGWFHTGDIGSVDGEGSVFIRGRKKEMIVTPEGLNVFPEDVERVLNETAGVREAAVVGVTASGRERVHAVLVMEPGAQAQDAVSQANRALEPHQQIQGVSVWPDDRLPRTEGTEKLKRVAIRDWVNGSAATPRPEAKSGRLLGDYADDTPLAELGLSSLDRVELMMNVERRGAGGIDEASFTQATTVGELRQLASRAGAQHLEPTPFPRWNRSIAARALRRVSLPLVLLPLLRIFVWLRVEGRENLRDTEGPVLFASNHQSVFDVPTLLAAMPARFRYHTATAMGTVWFRPHFHPEQATLWERLGNNLQYYLVCLFFNAFPIAEHESGARETLRYMGELAGEKCSVLIFPEGVRTEHGEIAPFRPGVGMMGSKLNLRVVPARIEGLDQVLHPSWHFPRPGRVRVKWGQAIEVRGEDYAALAKRVEAAVRAL